MELWRTLCIANDDGTYTSNINTSEAIAAMEWVQKMVQDKWCDR